jgi:hypothetical protein
VAEVRGPERVLAPGARRALDVQRRIGGLCAPLWIPLVALALSWLGGYRIERVREARARARALVRGGAGPILVCANHLTLVDSFLVAWALAPAWRYAVDFRRLPWNVPERANFAATPWSRAAAWLAKCIPVSRGGDRRDVAGVLERVRHVLAGGETALLFPEGGRSRSGRVDVEAAAYGVGRIVGSLPGCRVLCVYLRGRGQTTWSSFPRRGERFDVRLACIEPKSDQRGLRRSRDLARQIAAELARMEQELLDAR